MEPKFFKTPAEFRRWLEHNHDKRDECLVGFYKKSSGRKSMTWEEAVDVALCFGWIDSHFRPIDDIRRVQRFTPRKPKSNWSKRNVDRVAELTKHGLMHPAGIAAFERRAPANYSYENRSEVFPKAWERRLRKNPAAWDYFRTLPPGLKRNITYWVTSAKREETRERRFAKLVEYSARGERLPEFSG